MKNKLMFALSLAIVAAASAPLSAQASHGKNRNTSGVYDRNGDGVIDSRDQVGTGCTWYDVNCRVSNSRNGTTSDGSWQVIGRDRGGNTIYQRQRVDGNGNVIVDRARRDSYGRMIIIDSQVVNQNARRNNNAGYGPNGETCKYKQNKNGYSTNCKYNKVKGNKHRDNDGDEDDRFNNGGNYNNNTSGPWYDQGVNGNSGGKQHGRNH